MSGTSFFKTFGSPKNSIARGDEGVDTETNVVLIKDGHQIDHRVINLDNPKLCKRSGLIELVPMRRTSRHENKLSFATIHANGMIIGIPERINPKTKEIIFRRITLRDERTFDLSDDNDAMEWAVVKHSHYVEGSPNQRGKAKYKVYDKEAEAEKFLLTNKVKRKAETIADGFNAAQLREMGMNLGLHVEAMSLIVLQSKVIEVAEKDPHRFMEIWDSPTRAEMTIFKRAMGVGLITFDNLLGYCFGALPIGPTEAAAIQHLKENHQLCQTIDLQSKNKEAQSVRSMRSSQPTPEININDERDVEIARLKQQLEDEKLKVKKLADAGLNDLLNKDADNFVTNDPELAEMVKEGKALGIKSPHLFGKEKLIAKIEEIRATKDN